jgi:predicted nucleic-acid-binding protein
MILLDANYILRYLLRDNEQMFLVAKEVMRSENCLLLNEVIAEVVYVLEGVYRVPRDTISKTLAELVMMHNMDLYESKSFLIEALLLYKDTKLDFVDCCLCALKEKYIVKSFDKKLMKCIEK